MPLCFHISWQVFHKHSSKELSSLFGSIFLDCHSPLIVLDRHGNFDDFLNSVSDDVLEVLNWITISLGSDARSLTKWLAHSSLSFWEIANFHAFDDGSEHSFCKLFDSLNSLVGFEAMLNSGPCITSNLFKLSVILELLDHSLHVSFCGSFVGRSSQFSHQFMVGQEVVELVLFQISHILSDVFDVHVVDRHSFQPVSSTWSRFMNVLLITIVDWSIVLDMWTSWQINKAWAFLG